MKAFLNKEFFQKNVKSYIMILSIVVISLVFSILTKGVFLTPRNISMLARQTTVTGILAIGMMFVIVAGHIDLSVGQLLGFCGTLAAVLQVWMNWDTFPTIIVVIVVGMLLGVWQGYWVAYRRVPAFIITLGGMLIFRGMKLGLSRSASIAPMKPSFNFLGQAYLPVILGWIIAVAAIILTALSVMNKRRSKKKYNFAMLPLYVDILKILAISAIIIISIAVLNSYQGLSVPVLILLLLAIVFNFVANKSVYGRSVYAIGGNAEAAKLSGIKTKKITMIIFIIAGALSALAGIVLTARLDASTAAAGDAMEMDAIAACVIGGASLAGGIGKIPGVVIGALVMASLDNGMSLMNLENFWQFIVKGMVLILAVWADTATKAKD
jgi:D-xylose transport system permease protein